MNLKTRVAAYLLAAAAAVGGGATYLSQSGIENTAKHEGLRLVAYPDPGTGGAPWTICYGHTKGVKRGDRATVEQCERWLAEDLLEAERHVQRLVRVPLRQGEYDAYVSLVFNAGPGNFQSSTMLRLLNSGNWHAACNQFPRWIYANKRILNGLRTRRLEEQAICLRDGPYVYYPASRKVAFDPVPDRSYPQYVNLYLPEGSGGLQAIATVARNW